MKLKILSDLHLEFDSQDNCFIPPYDGEDILVLAGDIQVGLTKSAWFLNLLEFRDVIYITGNHEYYGYEMVSLAVDLPDFIEDINEEAERIGYKGRLFTLYYGVPLTIKGVDFIGGTLWTNLSNATFKNLRFASRMNDYHIIQYFGKPLVIEHTNMFHNIAVKDIKQYLKTRGNNKLVVVTHHAPSFKSIHDDYKHSDSNIYFASKLDYLVAKTDLWVHGHTHRSFDYKIRKSRVICNPRGYAKHDINPEFNPNLVVEI